MKVPSLPVGLVVLAGLWFSAGCATQPQGGSATVEFVKPEAFADLQTGGMTPAETIEKVLPKLRVELEDTARKSLPAGYALDLRITGIKESGMVRNAATANPVRIASDNSPAVVSFGYTVTGPEGQSVKAGSERLVQTAQGLEAFLNQSSPMPLVEHMLNTWIDRLGYQLARAGQ